MASRIFLAIAALMTAALTMVEPAPCLADDHHLENARSLYSKGKEWARQAMEGTAGAVAYKEAIGLLGQSLASYESHLLDYPASEPRLRSEIENVQALLYWCRKMSPLDGEEQPQAHSANQDEAQAALDRARSFEAANSADRLTAMARYFEVAERYMGTPASLAAQKRLLELQRAMAREVGGEEGKSPDGASNPGPAQSSDASRLGDLTRAAMADGPSGQTRFDYDFANEGQVDGWIIPRMYSATTKTRVSANGMLNLECSDPSGVAMLVSKLSVRGDITYEAVFTPARDPVGMGFFCHQAKEGGVAYAITLDATQCVGYQNLRFTAPASIKSGKEHTLRMTVRDTEISVILDDRVVWRGKDPAPLPGGQVGIYTKSRIAINRIRITGIPDPDCLLPPSNIPSDSDLQERTSEGGGQITRIATGRGFTNALQEPSTTFGIKERVYAGFSFLGMAGRRHAIGRLRASSDAASSYREASCFVDENSTTGYFYWDPPADGWAPGTYSVTIQVRGESGGKASAMMHFQVVNTR